MYKYVLSEKFAFIMNGLNVLHNNTVYINVFSGTWGTECIS